MTVKLISYDLGGPETSESYKKLIKGIESLGDCVKPLESFWLVDTNSSSISIRDHLKQYLDSNDKLLVSPFSVHDWAGWCLPQDVVNWLKRH